VLAYEITEAQDLEAARVGDDDGSIGNAVRLASGVADRYGISSLNPLISSCRAFAHERTLNVAVLGRFKAGKSSFLNHLVGRDLLPVGVVPVTSVVSEIRYGPRERAEVRFLDGRSEETPLEEIAGFIDESRNPENKKRVALVSVELPSLERFRRAFRGHSGVGERACPQYRRLARVASQRGLGHRCGGGRSAAVAAGHRAHPALRIFRCC
jgi:hypothetical protein